MAAAGYGAPDSSRAATCARLMLRSGSIFPGCAARSGSERTAGPTGRIPAVTLLQHSKNRAGSERP